MVERGTQRLGSLVWYGVQPVNCLVGVRSHVDMNGPTSWRSAGVRLVWRVHVRDVRVCGGHSHRCLYLPLQEKQGGSNPGGEGIVMERLVELGLGTLHGQDCGQTKVVRVDDPEVQPANSPHPMTFPTPYCEAMYPVGHQTCMETVANISKHLLRHRPFTQESRDETHPGNGSGPKTKAPT